MDYKNASGHKERSLVQRTLSGVFWNTLGIGLQGFFTLVTLSILAHILLPEDFGVVSSAILFVNFTLIFVYLGMGAALIHYQDISQDTINTAFTVVMILSILVFGFVQVLAPEISRLLIQKDISQVLRWLSICIILQGAGIIPESLIRKELDFRAVAGVKGIGFMVCSGVAICLALLGQGYWSLVYGHIAKTLIITLGYFIICRRRFCPRISFEELGSLLRFGGGFSLARVGNFAAGYGDNYIVIRFLGLSMFGIYEKAYQLMSMPANFVGQILDDVFFPSMAKVQEDSKKLSRAYSRGLTVVGIMIIPLSSVCFVLSDELVNVLLGEQWQEAILPLRILSSGMYFRSAYKISDSLARATGAVYRRALLQWGFAFLIITGSVIGTSYGLEGIALAVVFALTANYIFMAGLCLEIIQMKWLDILKTLAPGLCLGLFCLLFTFAVQELLQHVFGAGPIVRLVIILPLVFTISVFLCHVAETRLKNEDFKWFNENILIRGLRKLHLAHT
jgi:PST family polysaccharide transporter